LLVARRVCAVNFGSAKLARRLWRLLLAVAPVVLIAVFAQAPTNDDMLSHGDDTMANVLSHSARGTLRPAQEDSLQERLKNWDFSCLQKSFLIGLRHRHRRTSVGAWMFNKDLDLPPIDSYDLNILTCGIPAALLFMGFSCAHAHELARVSAS